MNILITGAGGAAAISLWKSLEQDHQLFMVDTDPCAAGLYLVPPERRKLLLPGDSDLFIPNLLALCVQLEIEVLIPTVDVELFPIAKEVDQFKAKGIKVPLSSAEALKICRDKYLLLSFCQDTGLTPSFALLTEETAPIFDDFPYFAKPRIGAGSRGALIIADKKALEQLPKDGSYLIQELLSGAEYSVDVYIHSQGYPLAAVPRLRMKIDSGIAVACQTKINAALSESALKIAEKVSIRYVANIQFKADKKGRFKLLEINPRFPGTLPLTAAAGIDIPKLLLKDLQNEPLGTSLLPFKELMVVRYWTEQFFPIDEWKALCPD